MASEAVLASAVDALLEPSTPIGIGRQSDVFGLRGRPTRVYKRYRGEVAVDLNLMLELIDLPTAADDEFRQAIERHTGWPRTLVIDDAPSVAGVLLQRAPSEFFIPDDSRLRPRTLDWLYIDPEESARVGITLRLNIVRSLFELLRVLHTRGYGHGDISDGNVLWSHESSSAYLLDCDGVARGDLQPVRPRPTGTADWLDPQPGASRLASDRYQAALFLWRVVLNDHGNLIHAIQRKGELEVPQHRLPGTRLRPADLLDDGVGLLWQRAFRLGGARDRPTMDEWLEALNRIESRVDRTAAGVRRRSPGTVRVGLDGLGVCRGAPGARRRLPKRPSHGSAQSPKGPASTPSGASTGSAAPARPSRRSGRQHKASARKSSTAWTLLLLLLVCVVAVLFVRWAMSARRDKADGSLLEPPGLSLRALATRDLHACGLMAVAGSESSDRDADLDGATHVICWRSVDDRRMSPSARPL